MIVTGEHFVVHGTTSLAVAIDKRARVLVEESSQTRIISKDLGLVATLPREIPSAMIPLIETLQAIFSFLGNKKKLQITIESEIPRSSGLGSSASVAVALIAAVSAAMEDHLTPSEIIELSLASEKFLHGNPSGIDSTVATYGGAVLFRRGYQPEFPPLGRGITLIIGVSGVERKTSEMVKKVANVRAEYPMLFDVLASSSNYLSQEAAASLVRGDIQTLGVIMNYHHEILRWMGLSTMTIDDMVDNALSQGAYGAKMTGAGGGGSIVAISREEKNSDVIHAVSKVSKQVFLSGIPLEGVKVWKEDPS